jgi:hypothetical protein
LAIGQERIKTYIKIAIWKIRKKVVEKIVGEKNGEEGLIAIKKRVGCKKRVEGAALARRPFVEEKWFIELA